MEENKPVESGDEVKLNAQYRAITKAMHNSKNEELAFICREDLKKIWSNTELIKAIIPGLYKRDPSYINRVKQNRLVLLSFLVCFKEIEWFDNNFVSVVFPSDGSPQYTDESMPLSLETLMGPFGMREVIAKHAWKIQFQFLPVRIDFHAKADKVQIIGKEEHLPLINKSERTFSGGYGWVEVSLNEDTNWHCAHISAVL